MIPVTLLCIDCIDSALAVAALRSGDSLPFAARILFSHERPENLPEHIAFVRIERIETQAAYQRFCLGTLPRLLDEHQAPGSHVLKIETDGFILRPELWRNEWLAHDYIGAPWPIHHQASPARVGNGGFCLRSRRLVKAATEAFLAAEVSPWTRNEDLYICRDLAESLSCRGMRFAPPEVAAEFSFEQPCDDLPIGPGRQTFGFHGRMTEATRRHCECLDRQVNGGKLRLIVNYYNDPYYPRAVEIDECLRANCGPGLFDEVQVLTAAGHECPVLPQAESLLEGWPARRLPIIFRSAESVTQRADVNVVANADIEFTPAACDLLRRLPRGEFWCLSRWENPDDPRPPSEAYRHCQDVWAWRGRLARSTWRRPASRWATQDARTGWPTCAHEAGYRVANPSLSVETRHVHQSGFRRYPATDHAVRCKDRIVAPYLYCEPHGIGDEPRIRIDHDGPNLPEAEEAMAAAEAAVVGT